VETSFAVPPLSLKDVPALFCQDRAAEFEGIEAGLKKDRMLIKEERGRLEEDEAGLARREREIAARAEEVQAMLERAHEESKRAGNSVEYAKELEKALQDTEEQVRILKLSV
jgi:hypothetical protein